MSTFTLIINIFQEKKGENSETNFVTIPGFSSFATAEEEGFKAARYYLSPSIMRASFYIVEVS